LNMTGVNLCEIASWTINPDSNGLQYIILLRASSEIMTLECRLLWNVVVPISM
jgi:hypothetical protein